MTSKNFILLVSFLIFFASFRFISSSKNNEHSKLSDYGFFQGELANLSPVEGVLPYDLNSPLFSDYSEKLRFIKIPLSTSASYSDTEVFDFPVGTVLIKNFLYFKDKRKPQKGRTILETRLMIHRESGWATLPYIWNDEQTEAYYEVAGDDKLVSWVDIKGKKQKLLYSIPNTNQCKGCHIKQEIIQPIGPTARQLNGMLSYRGEQAINQLSHWKSKGLLTNMPDLAQVPKAAVWDNIFSGTLDERARIYLDINCAHCHNKDAPANTSGLFLDIHQTNRTALGVNKTPVAAGRGSGGLLYDIVPGKPDQSILIYRMKSTDPGSMMPELGRKMIHDEGISLIEEWIEKME